MYGVCVAGVCVSVFVSVSVCVAGVCTELVQRSEDNINGHFLPLCSRD